MKTKQKHNPRQTEVNSNNRLTVTIRFLPGIGFNFHCTGYVQVQWPQNMPLSHPLSSGRASCRVFYPVLSCADVSVCIACAGLTNKWHWPFRVRPQALPESQMHTCNPPAPDYASSRNKAKNTFWPSGHCMNCFCLSGNTWGPLVQTTLSSEIKIISKASEDKA